MPDSTNLAARLLSFAPTAEVADALLTAAQIGDSAVPLGHAPSRTVGAIVAKRGVHYAATIAGGPADDPQLLDVLGRLPQKAVRRLVAGQPSTPAGVLEGLRRWAMGQNDVETLRALAGVLPPPEFLPTLPANWDTADHSADKYGDFTNERAFPVQAIVDNLVRRGDAAMTRETFALPYPTVRRGIVVAAATGRLRAVPAELIRSVSYAEQATLLDALLADKDVVLDDVLAELVMARLREDEELPEKYRTRARQDRTLTPEVAARFVDSGLPELAECVARSLWRDRTQLDDARFDALTHSTEPEVASVMLREPLLDRVTDQQLARLASHVEDTFSVRTTLKARGARLDDGVVVALLGGGDIGVTTEWLTGQLQVAPKAAQLAALVERPGRALKRNQYSSPSGVTAPRPGSLPESVPELVACFLGHIELAHLANPGVVDVLDAGGPATLRYATTPSPTRTDNPALVYLGARCVDRFGGFAPAWAALVQLADTAEVGSVSDLLTAVAGMVDLPDDLPATMADPDQDPETGPGPDPEPEPVDRAEQLMLL